MNASRGVRRVAGRDPGQQHLPGTGDRHAGQSARGEHHHQPAQGRRADPVRRPGGPRPAAGRGLPRHRRSRQRQGGWQPDQPAGQRRGDRSAGDDPGVPSAHDPGRPGFPGQQDAHGDRRRRDAPREPRDRRRDGGSCRGAGLRSVGRREPGRHDQGQRPDRCERHRRRPGPAAAGARRGRRARVRGRHEPANRPRDHPGLPQQGHAHRAREPDRDGDAGCGLPGVGHRGGAARRVGPGRQRPAGHARFGRYRAGGRVGCHKERHGRGGPCPADRCHRKRW